MQLVLQHCCKTSWKGMLRVLPPTFKPSCNKSGCCKLREYWLPIGKNYAEVALYTWVSSFATKQVCLGPVNRATYTDFVAKSRTTLYFLQQLLAINISASLRKQRCHHWLSPRSDVWQKSAQIPNWWRVTTPDLGRPPDWSCREGNLLQPIRNITQIWVVTRH